MAAEVGNTYAAKGRTIEKLIDRINTQEDSKRLREGLEKLMDKVAEGDQKALEFVRDSIDGKPKQQVDLGNADDKPLRVITKVELVALSGIGPDTTTP